jgi:hypothetical protein
LTKDEALERIIKESEKGERQIKEEMKPGINTKLRKSPRIFIKI